MCWSDCGGHGRLNVSCGPAWGRYKSAEEIMEVD